MVLPFLFLIFAWKVWSEIWRCKKQDNGNVKQILGKTGIGIVLCGLLVFGVDKLWDVNSYLWNRYPEYQEYRAQNSRRAAITDRRLLYTPIMELRGSKYLYTGAIRTIGSIDT